MKFAIFILTIFFFSSNVFSETENAEVNLDNTPYKTTLTGPHQMRIVNSGVASLYARLSMINRAQETIFLESYIFNSDTSGRLVMKALIEAAKRGVKVKLLVDKHPFGFKLNEYLAKELKENGVDVRYYNGTHALEISSGQYRNHRKLMVVDDKEAIAGGRNIGDEYFDLSKSLNFLDRDTIVKGDIVKTMRESFDNFWDSKVTRSPEKVSPPDESMKIYGEDSGAANYEAQLSQYNSQTKKAKKRLAPNQKDDDVLKFVMEYGKEIFEKMPERTCPEVSFSSDKEGASDNESYDPEYSEKYRFLRKEISNWFKKKVKSELTIDSPYFLDNKISEDLTENLLNKNIKLNIFTNSLGSTDAIHVANVFNDSIGKYTASENVKAYTYKGKFTGETKVYSDEIKNAIWGTHSKTMIFNEDSFMIGTFNVDNRSSHYNTELAIFCSGSKELTNDVKENIQARMNGSYRLDKDGNPDGCSEILNNVGPFKKLMYYLIKIPSHMLQFLL